MCLLSRFDFGEFSNLPLRRLHGVCSGFISGFFITWPPAQWSTRFHLYKLKWKSWLVTVWTLFCWHDPKTVEWWPRSTLYVDLSQLFEYRINISLKSLDHTLWVVRNSGLGSLEPHQNVNDCSVHTYFVHNHSLTILGHLLLPSDDWKKKKWKKAKKNISSWFVFTVNIR